MSAVGTSDWAGKTRPQCYGRNHRQLGRAGIRGGGPLQGRAHRYVVHCGASPENRHTSDSLGIQQCIFRKHKYKVCVYTNAIMHAIAIGDGKTMTLKESGEEHLRGLGGKEVDGEM